MLKQVKLDAKVDWFILTEECNNLANTLSRKYYQLYLDSKDSHKDDKVQLEYADKWKLYSGMTSDFQLFSSKELMLDAITVMRKDMKSFKL